jgi:hypothetical protein
VCLVVQIDDANTNLVSLGWERNGSFRAFLYANANHNDESASFEPVSEDKIVNENCCFRTEHPTTLASQFPRGGGFR